MTSPPQLPPQIPVIERVFEARIESERQRPDIPQLRKAMPAPPALPPPAQSQPAPTQQPKPPKPPKPSDIEAIAPIKQFQQKALPPDRQTPSPAPTQAGSVATTPSSVPSVTTPRIATAPSGQAPSGQAFGGQAFGGSTGQATAAPQGLSIGTVNILRAQACAKLDIRDRPADCPPNRELLELLERERGPHYRRENAEGFSRNELAWRGVPPPCLEDGQNSGLSGGKACIRFGSVPSRVRTVREICEAKGLGGCAPTPSQSAVNAALKQVRPNAP